MSLTTSPLMSAGFQTCRCIDHHAKLQLPQLLSPSYGVSRLANKQVLSFNARKGSSVRFVCWRHRATPTTATLSRDASSPEGAIPCPNALFSVDSVREGPISWATPLGEDGMTELEIDRTGALQEKLHLGEEELRLAEKQIRLGREQLQGLEEAASLGVSSSSEVLAGLGLGGLDTLEKRLLAGSGDSLVEDALLTIPASSLTETAVGDGASTSGRRFCSKAEVNGGHVDVFLGAERLRVYKDGAMELYREKAGQISLISSGRVSLPKHGGCVPENCTMIVLEDGSGAVDVRWSDDAVLRIVPAGGNLEAMCPGLPGSHHKDATWASKLEEGFVCEFSVRQFPGDVDMAEVTLDMNTAGHWFGGGHFMRQHWPLNLGAFEVGPYFPFDNGPNGLNTMAAPQWMTSRGLLVLADPDTPFFHVGFNAPMPGPHDGWIQRTWGVGVQNLTREYLPSNCNGTGDGQLRLQARSSYKCHAMLHPLRDWVPPLLADTNLGPRRMAVRFAMCALPNVKEATMAALKTFNKPANPPPKEMVKEPIWTTWARYHARVNQAKVEQFAHEIVARGLGRSVMEVDDKWQSKYGDFDFDPVKFPNPKAMVDLLHALGFKVTLWIMPFAEENSKAYKEGAPKGYFISSPATRGLKPGFFRWWQPVPAAALDVTNPEAVEWFVQRLKKLQADYNIDGFKFDAGEPCFLPQRFTTHKPMVSPVEYTRLYIEEVASRFSFSEVRTGHRTNSVPLLTRMGDRFSTWSTGNGLRSLIPTLLTSGLLGYPFCLPDMIGGNAYFGRKPDVELLVRWAQANAFMPAMQFSIPPWDLSQEAEKLTHSVLELRQKVVSQIVQLMEDACKALAPVCRPMWWLDPEDAETFTINDQFAIGDDIIVAPVVVKGQKRRDVYLPKGKWVELLSPAGEVFEGKQWLRSVEAPLHKVPIFRRVEPTSHLAPGLAPLSPLANASGTTLALNPDTPEAPTVNC